jgi:hypothetical protein
MFECWSKIWGKHVKQVNDYNFFAICLNPIRPKHAIHSDSDFYIYFCFEVCHGEFSTLLWVYTIVDVNILILNVILNAVGQRNIDIRLIWTLLIVYFNNPTSKNLCKLKMMKMHLWILVFNLLKSTVYFTRSFKFKNWLSQLEYQLITLYLLLAFTIFEITQINFFLKIRCNWFSALMKTEKRRQKSICKMISSL